jgi:hypothetical protein
MEKEYLVYYSGWAVVEANTEIEASQKVGTYLADSGIPNDGHHRGEWLIDSITEWHEEED